MKVIETERLILRYQTVEDAAFMLELLNDASYIENIGDNGVRTVDDAQNHITTRALDSYDRFGFGLFLVKLKNDGTPIGICGLVKRDFLDDVDIGFAFLPKFWGKGYAFEASSAVMDYAKSVLGLERIVAITSESNAASAKLLEKLGLQFEGLIPYPDTDKKVRFFGINFEKP